MSRGTVEPRTVYTFAAALLAALWSSPNNQPEAHTRTESARAAAQEESGGSAAAELQDRNGQTIGRATLTDTPNGVLVLLRLDRAPAGEHAFHIHAVGRCDAPTFESAGGHFNPGGARHGFLDAKGPHPGDLPNLHVPASGSPAE